MRRVVEGAIRVAVLAIAIARPGLAQEEPARATDPAPAVSEPEAEPAAEPSAQPLAPPKPAAPRAPTAAKSPAEIPKPSERAWVRGEVRVNYRTSASPNATPLGVLNTGEGVGVIERKGGWARILVGESSIGWLPESYLDAEPPPHEHVALLKEQVAELQKNLDESEREAASLRGQVAEASGQEAERDIELRRLRDENRDLQAGERWPYMVMGAGILAIGFVVGLIFRGGGRRSSARLRY
jgi:hypothetical protein